MNRGPVLVAALLGLLMSSLTTLSDRATAGTGSAGFSDTLVHSLSGPTAMAFTPDGRMLITQDGGQLRVVEDGSLLSTPALHLGSRICAQGERGLLGVAVDPRFATNHFVYLYWTHNVDGYCGVWSSTTRNTPENRVSRFVLGSNNRISAASEKVLVDHIPSPARNHNAGDLNFGADKLLYISVGDGGCVLGDPTKCGALNTNSRRLDIPNGKILRVTRSGEVPATNPHVGAAGARRCTLSAGPQPGTGPCTETYASGFRNPFRFAQVPGTNSFYVNDVGQSSWEEIDRLAAGKDYGWNVREGHCRTGSTTDCGPTPYQNPIHDYSHAATGCGSITGGTFVPAGLWPAPYSGSYLFADYVCGKIFRLAPVAGGGHTQKPFMTDVSVPVHLEFGPYGSTQALYYLDYGGGAVHRVTYSGANTAPVASLWQRPDGLTVTLDGSASYDPDSGDSVQSWKWNFGDGTSTTTTTPRVTHTYTSAQTYTATLGVTDSRGAESAPSAEDVYAGEHPPAISITAPATTARFAVDQQVTISAAASDPEDGTLPPSSISWEVRLKHGTHTHPYAGPVTGSAITVPYPAPEDLASTQNSYLAATAVTTDSRGLTSRADQELLPEQVTIGFATSPSGGRIDVDGTSRPTPVTLMSWEGYVLSVSAPDQLIGGVPRTFEAWSDGGARTHDLVTPASAATYTATFQ